MTHGGHELALQVYRFRVRMLAPRNSFLKNIRDSVGFPHALCPARSLLQYDAVFGTAAGAVSHAECAFVPGHEIDDIEARSVEPRAHALAQVKLVNPQEQVAGRDQGAIYAAHEVTDGSLGHLLQGAPPLVAILAFVAVGQLFEHTSILRIEEGDGHGGDRKHGQEREAGHLEAGVWLECIGQRQRRRVDGPLAGENRVHGHPHGSVNPGVKRVVGQFEFCWLALQALIPEIMPAEYPSEYASLDQSPSIKVSLIWQVVLYPTA